MSGAAHYRSLTVEEKLRLLLEITRKISRSLDLDEVLRVALVEVDLDVDRGLPGFRGDVEAAGRFVPPGTGA